MLLTDWLLSVASTMVCEIGGLTAEVMERSGINPRSVKAAELTLTSEETVRGNASHEAII